MRIWKNEKNEKIIKIIEHLKNWTTYKNIKKIENCWDNLIIFCKNLLKKEDETLKILGQILLKNIENWTINPEILENEEIENLVKNTVFSLWNAQL